VLVQHRVIQSRECLQRMSRRSVDIVRVPCDGTAFPPTNFFFHDSDGLTMRNIVQRSRHPLRASDISVFGLSPERCLIASRRFPHPVPAGTSVPQWALVAISVRSSAAAILIYNPNTVSPLHRVANTGIPARRHMSAVSNATFTLHVSHLTNCLFP
jgi:hypothetical protein